MGQHPNEKLLDELYDWFAKGDMPGVLGMGAPEMKWTEPGPAPFSGVYSNRTFVGMIGEVMRICNGTFREDPCTSSPATTTASWSSTTSSCETASSSSTAPTTSGA